MSDMMTDDNATGEQGGPAQLREALERANQKASRADQLERENVFLKAGVNVDTKLGKLLYDGYTGELDVDAIKAAAVEVGAIEAPAAPPAAEGGDQNGEPPAPPTDETSTRLGLGTDGTPPGAPEMPTLEDFYAEYRAQMAQGSDSRTASNAVIGQIMVAAQNGNPRFAYDAKAWAEKAKADSEDLI